MPARLISGAAVVALALLPLAVNGFGLHVATISLYYTTLAASWNLLAGMTGQFSLAHQAFAAIGAYTSGLLIRYFDVPILVGIVSGTGVSAIFGLVLGRIVLRMRAIYLAIATWAFAETVHILLTAAYGITRGELGLNVPPLYRNLDPLAYYYTFAGLTIVSVAAMWLLVRSPIGYFMRAIKDDELRAQSFGVDTTRVKVAVFTISSAFAGMAGAFYAHYILVLSPQLADFNEMAKLIVMTVVGGLGSFAGPLLGAAPVQVLTTYLAKYGEWDMVIYAVLVIALMRTQRGGLAALVSRLVRRG
ncbi:MAG TPA: branched-chain amino acid ABC transporter permease [Stellaceae bacterium]|nr:branched-chain amino acid ABC transporter permease [Stellaceae bacterium]